MNDEDKRVDMQVLEVCIERDSLNEWVFDRGNSLLLLMFYVSQSQHVLCILYYCIIVMF